MRHPGKGIGLKQIDERHGGPECGVYREQTPFRAGTAYFEEFAEANSRLGPAGLAQWDNGDITR